MSWLFALDGRSIGASASGDGLKWAYTEDQGLGEVGLSAILGLTDFKQFMLRPQAMSFFQKLYFAPFPPVSHPGGGWDDDVDPPDFNQLKLGLCWPLPQFYAEFSSAQAPSWIRM